MTVSRVGILPSMGVQFIKKRPRFDAPIQMPQRQQFGASSTASWRWLWALPLMLLAGCFPEAQKTSTQPTYELSQPTQESEHPLMGHGHHNHSELEGGAVSTEPPNHQNHHMHGGHHDMHDMTDQLESQDTEDTTSHEHHIHALEEEDADPTAEEILAYLQGDKLFEVPFNQAWASSREAYDVAQSVDLGFDIVNTTGQRILAPETYRFLERMLISRPDQAFIAAYSSPKSGDRKAIGSSKDLGNGLRLILRKNMEGHHVSVILFLEYDPNSQRFEFYPRNKFKSPVDGKEYLADALRILVEFDKDNEDVEEGLVGESFSVSVDTNGKVVSVDQALYTDDEQNEFVNLEGRDLDSNTTTYSCVMCHHTGHPSFRDSDSNFANQETKERYSVPAIMGYSEILAGFPWPEGVNETQKSAEINALQQLLLNTMDNLPDILPAGLIEAVKARSAVIEQPSRFLPGIDVQFKKGIEPFRLSLAAQAIHQAMAKHVTGKPTAKDLQANLPKAIRLYQLSQVLSAEVAKQPKHEQETTAGRYIALAQEHIEAIEKLKRQYGHLSHKVGLGWVASDFNQVPQNMTLKTVYTDLSNRLVNQAFKIERDLAFHLQHGQRQTKLSDKKRRDKPSRQLVKEAIAKVAHHKHFVLMLSMRYSQQDPRIRRNVEQVGHVEAILEEIAEKYSVDFARVYNRASQEVTGLPLDLYQETFPMPVLVTNR